MSDRLAVALTDGVLGAVLSRPDKRNAIDTAMVDALLGMLERAALDSAVRVVRLEGAGKDFCAGADLAELLSSADRSLEENAAHAAQLGEVFVKIRELPKPVVAVVRGRALAGGCGLATACDVILAHEAASFGYPEIQRGFVPAMVMAMLRRAVGEKVAFDLVATGRVLTAAEAAAVGLISRWIPSDGFAVAADEAVAGLATASPSAIALIKRQLYELEGLSFREAILRGTEVNAAARATPDFKQAVGAFLGR